MNTTEPWPPAPTTPAEPSAPFGPVRDELEMLIRARYPIVYVVTWEEERLEQHLRRIAQRRSKELCTWSLTCGLQRAVTGSPVAPPPRKKGLADPLEVLDTVLEHKQAAIYLLKDFHTYLGPGGNTNAAVIRRLREVAQALADSYKTVVISSPLLQLAPELVKDVTVLDYPLPCPADLDALLRRICDELAAAGGPPCQLSEAEREELVRAALGLTLKEAENVLARTVVQGGRLDAAAISLVLQEKRQIIRKSGVLEFFEAEDGLEAVGGLELLKEWLAKRSAAFSERAQLYGLPAPKGVLLVGVQGGGKSLCAKAVSRQWHMPLLRFDLGRVFSSLVGSSEENVRRAIAVAESIAPVVLWIDEIEKAFAGLQGSGFTDGGTTSRVMGTLLTWLAEKTAPVFVVATANDVTQLPPELLRKGRLDDLFFVDLPSPEERRQILAIHLAKRNRDPAAFDLDTLARAATGFSGAELEEAVISGLYESFDQERPLETRDILAALRETVPLSRTMASRLEALRQWAEGRTRPASRKADPTSGSSRRELEL